MDQRLDPYLRASGASVEQESLGDLLASVADPIIRRTVHSRLAGRWDDIEDVCSEARLELLLHLRRIKNKPGAIAIDDFAAYVGTLAGNTCHHYFRRRRSGRARLTRQIRFLLEEPEFRIRQKHGVTLCGLAGWPEQQQPAPAAAVENAARQIEGNRNLAVLLKNLFDAAGGPVVFEALVDVVARMWRIADDSLAPLVDPESVAAVAEGAEISIDRRRYAARLWKEIRQLPRPQRVALLLNLRDGRGSSILALFPHSGVASLAETAATLEVSEEKLAAIWMELPWDDHSIAAFLDCTRQQVINLRMAARKRLANRMGDQPA